MPSSCCCEHHQGTHTTIPVICNQPYSARWSARMMCQHLHLICGISNLQFHFWKWWSGYSTLHVRCEVAKAITASLTLLLQCLQRRLYMLLMWFPIKSFLQSRIVSASKPVSSIASLISLSWTKIYIV
jgi:hypothetical protein